MSKAIFTLVIIFAFLTGRATVKYSDFFEKSTLRIDYTHCGDSVNESIFLEQLKKEPYWAGTVSKLIDPFNYGEYMLEVYDSISGDLIFSRGYGSLFAEWQTTDEAKHVSRSFYETVICPFPKKTISIEIKNRDKKNVFHKLFSMYINPNNYFIHKEKSSNFHSYKVKGSGIPSRMVDLVIIPDGYTAKEIIKFHKDAERFASYLFNCSPYKENKDLINIWAVEATSAESGTDIPAKGIWKNTVVSTSFYTFDSERYLMSCDIKTIRDIASLVPYDQILILVNSDKYGGGGIYNFYNVCSSNNESSEFVFTHELGHGFAALADEYYSSDVAYSDYFDLSVEPFQPNITTLVDFESKWKDMVDSNVPIPTPVKEKYLDKVGAFEGGGYVAKGIYRPTYDCSMKSRLVNGFCPVCKKAIVDMIDYYTK